MENPRKYHDGFCKKRAKLHQKTDSLTSYDLWCQYYKKDESKMDAKDQAAIPTSRDLEAEKEKDQMDYYSGKSAGAAMGEPYRQQFQLQEEVPAVDSVSVVYAIVAELHVQLKELAQMDSEASRSLMEAARNGDRMALAEVGGMVRLLGMLQTNIGRRVQELKAQLT